MIPALRTKSYASGEVLDADGVKTSFATVASPVALTTADWNGAVVLTGGILDLPRQLTISRSNNAGQFSTAPIVVTYTRGGITVVDSIVPGNANGNDILRTTQAVEVLQSIALPAQGGTGGTFTIGVEDICCPKGQKFCGIELAANGTLYVQYGEASGAQSDAIPVVIANRCFYEIAPTRVLTASGKTAVGVTVYLGGI